LILSDELFDAASNFPKYDHHWPPGFLHVLNIAATTINNIIKFENNQPLAKVAG
jgi:hypothetical protein